MVRSQGSWAACAVVWITTTTLPSGESTLRGCNLHLGLAGISTLREQLELDHLELGRGSELEDELVAGCHHRCRSPADMM